MNYTAKVAERVREFLNTLPREVQVQVYQRLLVDLLSDLSALGPVVFPYANKNSFHVTAHGESPQRLRWWLVFIIDRGTPGVLQVESVRDANEPEPNEKIVFRLEHRRDLSVNLMQEADRCDQPCALACPDVCPLHAPAALPPIDLHDALRRFEAEAVRGVCDTGRYRMPYFVWGEGPPLVFIHGVMDSRHAWIMAASRLSAHFRCIAYDLPTGRDGARLGRITHANLVEDVWALLDHLKISRSYVLGSSFGSTIALTAMHQRPERLPRGVLQGGLALRPLRRVERFLARLGRWLPGTTSRLPYLEKVMFKVNGGGFKDKYEPHYRHFLESTGRTPVKAFARFAQLLGQVDMRPLLAEVKQPVLLFCGDLDVVARPIQAEILLKGLPNARRVIIEGCGHVPGYSHPEVLAEVVRQFLTPVESPVV